MGTEGDLWMKSATYREQPDVKFQYKYLMVLEATSSTTGQTKEIFVSSMDSLNVLRPESYRMSNIKFNQDDANLDGVVDSFTLEANVPLDGDEQIKSMQAVLFFDFRLQKRVKFDMESIAYTSFESGLPISGFDSKGSLMLRQTTALGIRNYFSTLFEEDTPLVDAAGAATTSSITDSNIGTILQTYRERDISVDFVEYYPIKTRALELEENGTFRLRMNVEVPEQEVLYIPTLVELLKDAWVKYLSVLVVAWFMLDRIKSFAFREHL